MKNISEKIIAWIIGISSILFVLIVCMYLIKDFIGKDYLIAFIGFLGSIIGGSLTLIGVYLTLKHQNNIERINKLPKFINDSWKIQRHLGFSIGLDYYLKKNPDIDDVKEVEEFYDKNEEWVTELSTTISPEVYNLVNSFFTHISDYSSYKNRGKLEKWFEEASEYQNKLSLIIDSFEKEYEKSK